MWRFDLINILWTDIFFKYKIFCFRRVSNSGRYQLKPNVLSTRLRKIHIVFCLVKIRFLKIHFMLKVCLNNLFMKKKSLFAFHFDNLYWVIHIFYDTNQVLFTIINICIVYFPSFPSNVYLERIHPLNYVRNIFFCSFRSS